MFSKTQLCSLRFYAIHQEQRGAIGMDRAFGHSWRDALYSWSSDELF